MVDTKDSSIVYRVKKKTPFHSALEVFEPEAYVD